VAELVDALDSKSSSARSAGSIPARGTNHRCCATSVGGQLPAAALAQISDSIFKQRGRQWSAISRRDAPEACRKVALEKQRGRRESRMPNAPAASRAK
jgi:hypothetical protein